MSLKYTSISPFETFAMLYRHSAEKYRTLFSWSVKHTRRGAINFSIYGAISTPSAIAVPAKPMRPPFLACRGLEGLLNMSTSWSTIWAIRLWSPCWWHSRICLRSSACCTKQDSQVQQRPTSPTRERLPSASRTSCQPTASRYWSLRYATSIFSEL
jgi:hypothetical protein